VNQLGPVLADRDLRPIQLHKRNTCAVARGQEALPTLSKQEFQCIGP